MLGERVRGLIGAVVDRARADGPVGVSIDERHEHLGAHPGDETRTPARTGPRLHDAEPARGLFVVVRLVVPQHPHTDPPKPIAVDRLALRSGHPRAVQPVGSRPLRHGRHERLGPRLTLDLVDVVGFRRRVRPVHAGIGDVRLMHDARDDPRLAEPIVRGPVRLEDRPCRQSDRVRRRRERAGPGSIPRRAQPGSPLCVVANQALRGLRVLARTSLVTDDLVTERAVLHERVVGTQQDRRVAHPPPTAVTPTLRPPSCSLTERRDALSIDGPLTRGTNRQHRRP